MLIDASLYIDIRTYITKTCDFLTDVCQSKATVSQLWEEDFEPTLITLMSPLSSSTLKYVIPSSRNIETCIGGNFIIY